MKLSTRLFLWVIRTKFKLLAAISKKKAASSAFRLFCTPRSRHKVDLPGIFESSHEISFTLNSTVIRGWRWNLNAGKKAMVLHGFESSVTNFEKYISALIDKGYEVFAFDAPAHGRSDGKTITAPFYRDMILKVEETYGPVNAFIAHSFGGLALSLAMEQMDDQENKRMVLVAPATETSTAIDDFFRLLKLPSSIRPLFEAIIITKGGHPSHWYSITRAAENIKAKVFWVHDEDDDTTPVKDLDRIRSKNYKGFTFFITKGLGHRRIYRDRHVIQAILNFL